MAVQYSTHSEIIDTDQNNQVTVTVPSGLSEGDVWLIIVTLDTGGVGTISTPAGFTAIGTQFNGAGGGWPNSRCFYKVAGASESSVTVSYTGTDYDWVVYSIRLTESASADIELDATGTPYTPTGSGTTTDAPDITIGADSSLAVLFKSGDSGAVGTFTAPSGATLRDSRVANWPTCGFATEARNAGAYAPGTWGHESDSNRCAHTFSFKPAAGGGTTYSPGGLGMLGVGM